MLNRKLFEQIEEIQIKFRGSNPLLNFIHLNDFLEISIAKKILSELNSTSYDTYCAYSLNETGNNIITGFCEPNEAYFYTTIHKRPIEEISSLETLYDYFSKKNVISFLSSLCGERLSRIGDKHILTYWPTGSFLDYHTDDGRGNYRVKLVLSISFTLGWKKSFGGITEFNWNIGDEIFKLKPKFNSAFLFRPFSGSFHRVTQVSEKSKSNRFTWTIHFL